MVSQIRKYGRLARGERCPAFREFINAAGLEMKSVDEHKESISARGEDCASHGWARHAPADHGLPASIHWGPGHVHHGHVTFTEIQ